MMMVFSLKIRHSGQKSGHDVRIKQQNGMVLRYPDKNPDIVSGLNVTNNQGYCQFKMLAGLLALAADQAVKQFFS